jgi:hypothetical protein
LPGNTSKRSERRLKLSDLSDRPKPPPLEDVLDNEPLREVADSYTDVLGAALIAWLRANRRAVLLALEDD